MDSTREDFGVRAAVHEFPGSDTHFTEALGRKARRISIEGYFVGRDWVSARDDMIRVAESGRPRTLRHPFYRAIKTGVCLSFSVNSSKDELGLTRFTMEIVEDLSLGGLKPTQFLRHLIRTGLDGLVDSASASFSNGLNVRGVDDSVRSVGIASIRGWAEGLDGARILTTLTSGAALSGAIEVIYDGAEQIIDGTLDLGSQIKTVIREWRAAATDASNLAGALEPLIFAGMTLRPIMEGSPSLVRKRGVQIEVDRLFRRSFGGLWAENVVSQDYGGRSEATAARNGIVRWFDAETSLVSPDAEPQVLERLDRFRHRVVSDMEQKWTDSAPVVDVKLPRPMSAIALATRMYGDPSRAEEIWRRNPSPSMSLIGPDVEVLAR